MYTATLISGSTVAFVNNTASHMGAGHVVLALSLCAASLCFLFLTGCSDPGKCGLGAPSRKTPSPLAVVFATCARSTSRWARTIARIATPVSSTVHHCPWMGKCVGKRNMRWFQLFNLTWVVYLIFVLVVTFQMRQPRVNIDTMQYAADTGKRFYLTLVTCPVLLVGIFKILPCAGAVRIENKMERLELQGP